MAEGAADSGPGAGARRDAVRALKAGRKGRARGPPRVSSRLMAPTESLTRKMRPASAPVGDDVAASLGPGAGPAAQASAAGEGTGNGPAEPARPPRGESLDDFEGVETARIRAEEDALRRRAAELQNELQSLAESRLRLAMRAEEQRLRAAAREQLARFEVSAGEDLGRRVAELLEERGEKVAECGRFRSMVHGKIDALKQILVQLQRRQEKLEGAYDAAVKELREEHSEALEDQKGQLEASVRQQLARHLGRLRQSKAPVGAVASPPSASPDSTEDELAGKEGAD